MLLASDNKLGDLLRSTRRAGAFGSGESFARVLGVNKNTLGSYERGRVLPDVGFLAKFAQTTGVSFQELLRIRLAAEGIDSDAIAYPQGSYSINNNVEWELLETAITDVEALSFENGALPPKRKAKAIMHLYNYYHEREQAGDELSEHDRKSMMEVVRSLVDTYSS